MNMNGKKETKSSTRKITEFEVSQEIGTISQGNRGFSKELNVVAWSDKPPVFDLRAWRISERDDVKYPLRVITFKKDELITLRDILNNIDFDSIEM